MSRKILPLVEGMRNYLGKGGSWHLALFSLFFDTSGKSNIQNL
jgi:hypothetical protein